MNKRWPKGTRQHQSAWIFPTYLMAASAKLQKYGSPARLSRDPNTKKANTKPIPLAIADGR